MERSVGLELWAFIVSSEKKGVPFEKLPKAGMQNSSSI